MELLTLFLCGDVMTGRGIDQILPHPSDPHLYEPYVTSALEYVELAERRSRPIVKPVRDSYIWGDALEELEHMAPDLRIINLETSITTSGRAEPKGINYRMHPDNVACLEVAEIDCCALANNHVLDWGREGLLETVETLRRAKIPWAGAGRSYREAIAPAALDAGAKGRVLVFSFGTTDSGIPGTWCATEDGSGVWLLADLSSTTAAEVAEIIHRFRTPYDTVVASVHWGSNWGYDVPASHPAFAHALIDRGAVDVVHGHSSHHPRPIELYRGKLILYGCGDFLNDYEGISGYDEFRGDLVLMYFARLRPGTHDLAELVMTPMRIQRMRLERAEPDDATWLRATLNRASARFGTRVLETDAGRLVVRG